MTDDLLEILRRADPLDEEDRVRSAPADQLPTILNSTVGQPESERKSRIRPRRVLAVTAVVAVGIGVTLAFVPSGSEEPSSDAVRALESVAAIARADAAAAAPQADGYSYSKITRATIMTIVEPPYEYSYRTPVTMEAWVAPDGSGRVREISRDSEWLTPEDEEQWRAAGSPPLGNDEPPTDERFGPGELNDTGWEGKLPPTRELPASSERLSEIFEEQAGISSSSVPVNVKSFEYATSVLFQAGSAPELRAALYELVADLEGVELSGTLEDPLGRVGTAVSIESDYSGQLERYTLIFDADTSQPLAYTETLLEQRATSEGRTLGYALLKETAQVADPQSRP
jgi:hypothetical protein